MEKTHWSNSEIHRLFRLETRIRSRQTLFKAEERGDIPKAERIQQGSHSVRRWRADQLPKIGQRYGFLDAPQHREVICVYTAKGGVLKTTLSYSIARLLALHGIKTLIIGLDIQHSITELALPQQPISSLDDYDPSPQLGLFHLLYEDAPLTSVIKSTSLPTLDIIPETPELNALEKRLRNEIRREYFFKDKLLPHLKDYDVVIFDNGPNWNQLIENALVGSNTLLSPIGCDLGTYQALKTNLSNVTDFQKAMHIEWKNFLLVPTLLEKTKLSQQIYGAYLNQYSDNIVSTPIRRGIKGQEALVLSQTPLEYDAKSPLAQDYFELMQQIWGRILTSQTATQAA